MVRLTLFAVLALASGCKSMGGLASGLGHAASGLGHVASGIGHATSGIGHVASGLGHVASGAGHVVAVASKAAAPIVRSGAAVARVTSNVATPIAETLLEAAATTPIPVADDPPEPNREEPTSMSGPLIDDHDPCNRCPEDLPCDQCVGFNDVVCRYTPPDAHTRCESSN